MMPFKIYLLFLPIIIVSISCKKSKTKKEIIGNWEVTAMYSDEADFLLKIRKGNLKFAGCDTINFERQEILQSKITINKNESYLRKNEITIKYIDTAASRLQCAAVYADSLINTVEEGTWRFEGKETLELAAQNKNYEGNKLVFISDNAMEWQTDLTVEQGFVVFKGLKTTKLKKSL